MINDNTIQLILQLVHTRSVYDQLAAIKTYCLLEADMSIQKDQVMDLISNLEQECNRQSDIGRSTALKRKVHYAKKGFTSPKFFPQFKGYGKCDQCGHTINGKKEPVPAFFLTTKDEKSRVWCPTPGCFPSQYKLDMESDKDYIKFIQVKL